MSKRHPINELEEDIEQLFELIGRHGIEERSEQARLLLKIVVSAPDLMEKLEKQNPKLAQEVVGAGRTEGLLSED